MPSFRKMSPEEVAAIEGSSVSSRKAIAEMYDDLVRDLTEGDNIELELEPDERRQTVIARLRAAAARRQPALQLEFIPSDDPIVLHFMIPVLTPPAAISPAPSVRQAAELPDMIDDQSQSLLNLRDTRDRRDYQSRNNRYDRRPHTNRAGTARVNRSSTPGRFQSSGRSSQPLLGRRNGPSAAPNGPRNDRPSSNNGPRNDRPPSNNGPRNGPPPTNNGPRNDRPSSNNGPRNGPPPTNNGPRNDRPPPNNGPRNGPPPAPSGPRNGPPPANNGPRNDRPTDRPPSAPYNRQRQRRRTR